MFSIKHIFLGTVLSTTVVGGVFGGPDHAGQLEERRAVVTRYVTQWYNRTKTVSGTYAFGTGGTGSTGMFSTRVIPPGVFPTGSGHVSPTGQVGYNGTDGVAPVKGAGPTGHGGYNGSVGVDQVYGNMTTAGDITTFLSTVFVVPTGFVDRGSLGNRVDWLLNSGTSSTLTNYGDLIKVSKTIHDVKPIATSLEELYGDANTDLLGKRKSVEEKSLGASCDSQMQKHTTRVGFLRHTIILRGVPPTRTPHVYDPSIFGPSICKLFDNEIVAQLANFPHNGGDLGDEAFAKVIEDAEKAVEASRQARPVHSRDVDDNGEDVFEEDLTEFLNFLDLLGLITTDSNTTKSAEALSIHIEKVSSLEKLNRSVKEAIDAIGDDFPEFSESWFCKLHYSKGDEPLTGRGAPLQTSRQTVHEALNAVRKDFPKLPKRWFCGGPSVDADIEVLSYNRPGSVNNSTTSVAPTQVQVKFSSVPVPTLEPQTADLLRKRSEQNYLSRHPKSTIEKRQAHEIGAAPHYDNSSGSVNPTGTAPKVDLHIPAAIPVTTLVPIIELLSPELLRQWLEHRHPKRDLEETDAVEGTGEPLEVAKRDPDRRLGENKLFLDIKPSMETTDSELDKHERRLGENKNLGEVKPGMEIPPMAADYLSPPLDALRRDPGRILGEDNIFRNIKPKIAADTDCKTYVLEISNRVTRTISTVGVKATAHVKRIPTTLIKVRATGVKAN